MPQTIDNLSVTWANSLTTFTAFKFNAIDNASAAGSLLMDFQVGGSSRFNVGKTGSLKLGVNPTGTNQAGTNVTIAGSQGTGTGAGGSIVFQVAPAGSSGTAQNALATALTIGGDKNAVFTGSIAQNAASNTIGGAYWNGTNYTAVTANPSIIRGSSQNLDLFVTSGISEGATFSLPSESKLNISNASGIIAWVALNCASNVQIASASQIGWASSSLLSTPDVILRRDEANKLALRNGANAQTFRVYNTTDGTNSEFGSIKWNSNVLQIGTEATGTGANRNVEISAAGQLQLTNGAGIFILFKRGFELQDSGDIKFPTSTGAKIGTATNQKIGFWNATPIVQPTTAVAAATVAATGTGDVVAASTTFDGYTIPQIVKALRNAGLLA